MFFSILAIFRFQSTLPARGATENVQRQTSGAQHFNPRSPHGERRVHHQQVGAGGAISIHAPRTGSDSPSGEEIPVPTYFNPRSPHGERQIPFCCGRPGKGKFQSTLPARGATIARVVQLVNAFYFNPRSPHGERRGRKRRCHQVHKHFNPRSPHGERLRKVTILSIRIIGFAQKVYHKTVLLRISLAENAVILPEKPRNPVRTSLQKAGGLRFARAIRAARPYSISSPSGA